MTPKRGDHVAPPTVGDEWNVRFASAAAVKGWEELCRQATANTRRAWELIRNAPDPAVETPRHHRLRPPLHMGTYQGRTLPRWQVEVTGAARV